MHRITIFTMDDMTQAKDDSWSKGFDAGKVEGFVQGEKETWRALLSIALLGAIVAIAVSHFNSLI